MKIVITSKAKQDDEEKNNENGLLEEEKEDQQSKVDLLSQIKEIEIQEKRASEQLLKEQNKLSYVVSIDDLGVSMEGSEDVSNDQ